MTQKVHSKVQPPSLSPMMVLKPHIVDKIWGGYNLAHLKGLKNVTGKIGETWEISCLKEGPSSFSGTPLYELVDTDKLPYLVKFLDTTDNLSIQVHPGNDYAKVHENTKGKTECWLILTAQKQAGIYLGFKPGVTKESFEEAIKSEEKKSLERFLNFVPVKGGDFFFVPAGTVHAIGKGITLAEIQQSSGVTYRVWDWNRVDDKGNGRELHIEKSLDVLEFDGEKNNLNYFKHQKIKHNEACKLVSHTDFNVEYRVNDQLKLGDTSKRYISLVVLEGQITAVYEGSKMTVSAYESALIIDEKRIETIDTSQARYLYIY